MLNNGIALTLLPISGVTESKASDYKLLYVINGEMNMTCSGYSCVMSAADYIVINKNETFSMSETIGGTVLEITFDSMLVEKYYSFSDFVFYCCSVENDDPSIDELRKNIQLMIYEYLSNGFELSLPTVRMCYFIFETLVSNFAKSDNNIQNDGKSRPDKRVREIVEYIQNNYSSPITLSDLASKFFISESHLSRIFKNVMGIGFKEYLTKIRLKYAMEDLKQSSKSIIRIANDNGFPSLSIFNKSFKNEYGSTPSDFRKSYNPEAQPEKEEIKIIEADEIKAISEAYINEYNEKYGKKDIEISATLDAKNAINYIKPWKDCINVGVAEDLLNPRVQEHILKLKSMLDFTHVRFWGMFLENFIVYPKSAGNALSFNKLDEVLSFLIKNGLKPFIQFGPKGRSIIATYSALSNNDRTGSVVHDECYDYISKLDDNAWNELIENVICHIVTKFGGQEVASWIFEMWMPAPWDRKGEWSKWYNNSKFASVINSVKRYVPGALVGGCEFIREAPDYDLCKMARDWREEGIDPDFISFSFLPYQLMQGNENRISWRTDIDYIRECVAATKRDMQESGLGDKKIFVTTWNISASNRNIINDTVHKGAYIVKNAIDSVLSGIDMISYWLATDIFAEFGDTSGIVFGGAGLLTVDGIGKPSMYAFEFLRRLRSRFIAKGENYIVTRNEYGIYTIVYCNCVRIPLSALAKDESIIGYEDINSVNTTSQTINFSISVTGVANGIYNVRRQKVNNQSGSILDNWHRMGVYDIVVQEDKDYIAAAAKPERIFERLMVKDGIITISISAIPDEFGVVEIEFQPGL